MDNLPSTPISGNGPPANVRERAGIVHSLVRSIASPGLQAVQHA